MITFYRMTIGCLFLAGSLFAAGEVQRKTPSTQPASLKLKSLNTGSQTGLPTEEDIKAFLTEYANPSRKGESIVFNATFEPQKLTPDLRRKYERTGKVPYRVIAELTCFKEIGGEKRYVGRILEGSGSIVIMDEKGALVKRAKESVNSLCPS